MPRAALELAAGQGIVEWGTGIAYFGLFSGEMVN